MADEQREIVRYEFQADLGDLEAKARRASEVATGIDQKMGRFTTPLMRDQAAEAAQSAADQAAFAAFREKAGAEEEQLKKNSSATAELIQHKRGLVNVIGLLGGSFGGLAGHLIGLVALITQAGAAMAGWIAAAVGITILVTAFERLKAEAKAAADAQRAFNDAVREGQEGRGGRLDTLGERLESYGARSEKTTRAAEEIHGKLGELYGVRGERAVRAATLAAGLGLGTEDAARLAVGIGAGAGISTLPDASRFLSGAENRGESDTLLRQAESFKQDTIGKRARIRAAAPMETGRAGLDPIAEAFAGLKEQLGGLAGSGFPADMRLDEFRAAVNARSADVKAVAREVYPGELKLTGEQYTRAEQIASGAGALAKRYVQQARDIVNEQDRVGSTEVFNEGTSPFGMADLARLMMHLSPQLEDRPGQRVQGVVNNYNITHIGTAYNDRDGPARQREQRSHFNLDGVDIKAQY